MAYRLSDIVGMVNIDGFAGSRKFYCEELEILRIGDAAVRSFFFDLGIRWRVSPRKIGDRGGMLAKLTVF